MTTQSHTYLRLTLLSLMLAYFIGIACTVSGAGPIPGTVYATRNLDESQNTSPGHLNHLAIVSTRGTVIESQADSGVIETKLADFLARPYETPVRYCPRDPEVGIRAAKYAESLVGSPYGQWASVNPVWRFGSHSCVSVIEASYDHATGRVWLWIRRPDHVTRLVGEP